MVLGTAEAGLLGAGTLLASAATVFYRRKQTVPFKVAYFLTWPVLGTGIIWTVTPSPEQMMRTGAANKQRVEEAHRLSSVQMELIKAAAEGDRQL